ncbi:MAG: hypothetical protein WAV51_04165 [Microgenomates group bacterium]
MNRFLTRKRNINFLILTVVLLSLFSWFVISIPASSLLNHIFFYSILFGINFSFFMFLFAKYETAVVFSGGIVLYFILRFLHLRHPLYGILLFICCIAILRLTTKKERETKNE